MPFAVPTIFICHYNPGAITVNIGWVGPEKSYLYPFKRCAVLQ